VKRSAPSSEDGRSSTASGGEGAAIQPIWEPSPSAISEAKITEFRGWLEGRGESIGDSYEDLWRWSVSDLDRFWRAIWDFFEVRADGDPAVGLADATMPGTVWFPGVRLNYAENLFAGKADSDLAILHASESRPMAEIRWGALKSAVASFAAALRGLGVERGDRVVGYLPNIPEAIVALLGCASIGAIWSSASPDFGAGSVIDRFAQIDPTVLVAVDGYRYGGKDFDRMGVVEEIRDAIPNLRATVLLPYLDADREVPEFAVGWEDLLSANAGAELSFERVPFDHPLWILYSSGTTGLPKAIVQGHGGILLEHLKAMNFHVDPRPGDRLFWFTTTGWMVWNFMVSGLLTKAAIVVYDGSPAYPDLGVLWDLVARAGVTMFGTSAAFIAGCIKAGIRPRADRDLSALRAVGSTGSALAPESFDWVYREVGSDIWLYSASGGTDLCTAFVGGVPTLPVYRGEIQARVLGGAVEAWDDDGNALIGKVGELVVTEPMPSMPLFFWGDEDGERYRESYFEMYPGNWRHGDWLEITERGTAIIYGRSDSTINRGGIRIGTAEIYRAVLGHPEAVDALVVDLPDEETDGRIVLFVVLEGSGDEVDDRVQDELKVAIRERCSPRHVPDEVVAIAEVPRTLTGKPVEVPVKRILMGADPTVAVSRDSLANPGSIDFFVALAERRRVSADPAGPGIGS